MTLLACTLVLPILHSHANTVGCGINFNYGVIINPKHIRYVKNGLTRIQINDNKQLFINGKEQWLNQEQAQLLTLYSKQLTQQVPEIITIATEGVDLGLKTVTKLIASLTGENSTAHQKIQDRLTELQQRFHLQFNQTSENFYLAPQDFKEFDHILAGQFEKEIEAIVSDSVGTLLTAVGQAITQKNDIGLENRSTAVDDRISLLKQELTKDITAQSNQLQHKAEMLCKNLVKLNNLETKVTVVIPSLVNYDLIELTEYSEPKQL